MNVRGWKGKREIDGLPLPSSGKPYALYPCANQPGLYVRVTRKNARSYVVDKNTSMGRVRPTLGTVKDYDGTKPVITPTQAIEKARIALGLIAQGYTREQIERELDRVEERIPEGALTLNALLEQYIRERAHKLSERTRSDYRRLVDTYLPDWKARPIEALNDEEQVIAKFTSISAKRPANYTFQVVRLLFNYARSIRDEDGQPVVTSNPVDVLSQRRLWHDEKPKREVIDLAALPAWWRAVNALESGGDAVRTDDGRFAKGTAAVNSNASTVRDFLIFLLLTGLRRNEAANLRWEDVDLTAKVFTLPITKNREPHTLPMGRYLFAMMERRHESRGESHFVFPGEQGGLAEPKKLIAKVVAASGVEFSAHTLRRTFATIAESLDIPFLALKRLLNHKPKDVTGLHYTVIGVERLREPMQKIEDFVLNSAGVLKTPEKGV